MEEKITALENRLKLAVGTKHLNGWFLHVIKDKVEGFWNQLINSYIGETRLLILMKDGIVYRVIISRIPTTSWLPARLRIVEGLYRVEDSEEISQYENYDRVAQWQSNVHLAHSIDALTPMMEVFVNRYVNLKFIE